LNGNLLQLQPTVVVIYLFTVPQILALICLLCKKRAKISLNINYVQCCFWNQEFYNIKRRAQKVHICEFKNYINNRANVSELTKCLDVTIWCKGL